jgi:hypothetical protein
MLNSKYLEWFSSIYGEVFRGGYIARGTKVLNNLPIRKIDFDNTSEKSLHDAIVKSQQDLIALYSQIDENRGNPRLSQPLQKQFEHEKSKLDSQLKRLLNLGDRDNLIPMIKELYAVD